MEAIDLKALFEELRFADSQDTIGLQLADIVASTFHRACKGQSGSMRFQCFGIAVPSIQSYNPHHALSVLRKTRLT